MKPLALRIDRRLAFAFPHEFQIVYGADVIQLGEAAVEDIWAQHGFFGLIRLLADIAVRRFRWIASTVPMNTKLLAATSWRAEREIMQLQALKSCGIGNTNKVTQRMRSSQHRQ